MRVIYFYPFEGIQGVEEKVQWQVQSLLAAGVDCIAYFVYSGGAPNQPSDSIRMIKIPKFNYRIRILERIKKEFYILDLLKNHLATLNDQDILYMRIPYPSIFLTRILSRPRTSKFVIEYQNIEPAEYRSLGKYWYLVIDYIFGDDVRKYSDAIVGVTEEITQYELRRSGDSTKPHITVGNGYNVGSVCLRESSELSNNGLDLLCVANVSPWHGLDRLIRGLALYDGNTEVKLHIAGEGSELSHLQKISADLGISERVIFHGYQSGKTLEHLFNICHLAVGTLGIHRKGLTQGSDLKSRQYFARGIPYIIACDDPDIPEDCPYTLRLPPKDDPIQIEMIVEFAKNVYDDPQHAKKMRMFAVEHLDWSVKMIQLKRFFEFLIADNSHRQQDHGQDERQDSVAAKKG